MSCISTIPSSMVYIMFLLLLTLLLTITTTTKVLAQVSDANPNIRIYFAQCGINRDIALVQDPVNFPNKRTVIRIATFVVSPIDKPCPFLQIGPNVTAEYIYTSN